MEINFPEIVRRNNPLGFICCYSSLWLPGGFLKSLRMIVKKEGSMKTEVTEIEINGEAYVKKSSIKDSSVPVKDGMKYVIVRTYSAGVFAGFLESRVGQEVVMRQARRIFYWDGAASLSQLAINGTTKPQNCKFPEAVDRVELLQAIEILDCTTAAKKSIESVGIWKM